MWHRLSGLVLGLGLLLAAGGSASANPAVGVWLTDDRKAKVRVRECGKGLCSNIIWLRQPKDDEGRPLRDYYNPDPKLKRRRIIGLPIMRGLKKSGAKSWTGHIYNPENGKTYEAHLTVAKPNLIVLKGCTLWGWPCGTKHWTRVSGPRPKPKPKPEAVLASASEPSAKPAPKAKRSAPAERKLAALTPPAPEPRPETPAARPETRPLATQPRPMGLSGAVGEGEAGYVVQVAARRSQDGAIEAFGKLKRRFPRLLGDYQPIVQRADLGDKGVWYRLRVGPMNEQTAAVDLCRRLRAAGGPACFVRQQ